VYIGGNRHVTRPLDKWHAFFFFASLAVAIIECSLLLANEILSTDVLGETFETVRTFKVV
jgi:hypothetical protein